MNKGIRRTMQGALAVSATTGLVLAGAGAGTAAPKHITFSLNRSTVAATANCLQNAQATVTVTAQDQVEVMVVKAKHLPKNTGFDLFVLETPSPTFGVSWYQGDLDSDGQGNATGTYIGRFNAETFAVSPGSPSAPQTHPGDDAAFAQAFKPVHTYHVGFWFDTPAAAGRAGCPTTVTPFNGSHTAGVQAMSSNQFGRLTGPLLSLKP